MSVKREIKAFTEDGEQHWEAEKFCEIGKPNSGGYVSKVFWLRKESAENVPWSPCVHIGLCNFSRLDYKHNKRTECAGFTLNTNGAKSLRNWLIEQYPLELTELALLKAKMELKDAN